MRLIATVAVDRLKCTPLKLNPIRVNLSLCYGSLVELTWITFPPLKSRLINQPALSFLFSLRSFICASYNTTKIEQWRTICLVDFDANSKHH